MNGRERAESRAADARDSLTMHRLMEAEGRELLRVMEQLEQDPSFTVPPELDARCMETIDRAFRKPKKHRARTVAIKAFRYLAAATLTGSLLFITAFATVEEVREGTLKLLADVTQAYTRYTLVPKGEDEEELLPLRLTAVDTDTMLGYRFPQMPEGFSLHSEHKDTSQASARYLREDGAEIDVTVRYYLNSNASVSTGDAQVTPVNIQGYEGQLISRSYVLPDGQTAPWTQLLWGNTHQGVLVSLVGYRVDGSTLLELAYDAQWVGLREHADRPVLMGYQLPAPPEGFWLESYGKTDTEHYAQYRRDAKSVLRFQVSTQSHSILSYRKDGDVMRDVSINLRPGWIITGSIRNRYHNIMYEVRKTTLLWSMPTAQGDLYLQLDGYDMPQQLLISLAEGMRRTVSS